MAFQINGEQMHYSVKSVDSWVTSWGKKINQSWIYASQPNLRQIRDLMKPQITKRTLGHFL